jgi:transposase
MHSKEVIQKVKQFYQEEKSLRKVAARLDLSVSSVSYILNNNYDKVKKKRGPKTIINKRKNTLIKKEVRKLKGLSQKVTAEKIKTACNIDANIRTVQRKLSELNFKYGNVQKKLPLNKKHKEERVRFADKCIKELKFVFNTIFSDEKRFSFDGPDN